MIDHIRHRFVRIYQSYFPARLSPEEHEFIHSMMGDELRALFYSQPLCDQRHGLLVFNKAIEVFESETDAPTKEELLYAACFHDVAKRNCNFSVTQRIIAATIMGFVSPAKSQSLLHSKIKIAHRIGIYACHSELSHHMFENLIDSEFVTQVTLHHHSEPHETGLSLQDQHRLELFIAADTL